MSVKVDPDAVAMLLGDPEDPENYREPDQQSDEEDYGLEDDEDHGYAKVKSPSDVKSKMTSRVKLLYRFFSNFREPAKNIRYKFHVKSELITIA